MVDVKYSQRTERPTSQLWQSNERTELPMRRPQTFPILIFFIILGAGIALAYSAHGLSSHPEVLWLVAIAAFVALFAASAMKVADQWDRAVILRLGKFHALQGPGLFFIIPIIEQFATGLILASSRRLSGLKRPSRKTRCLSMWMQSCFGKSSTRKKQHSMWQNIRQP